MGVKIADAMGGFIEGANAGTDLVHKAVDLERKQFELQEKRTEVAANKMGVMNQKIKNVMLQKGKMREFAVEDVEHTARLFDVPFHPATKEWLKDENNYADIGTWLTTMSEVSDKKQLADAFNNFGGVVSEPNKLAEVAEKMAKVRADKEQARLAAQKKNQASLNPQDSLKLTNETAANIKNAQSAQIETIRAVNNLNALASDPVVRESGFAQDSAQTLFQKMNDPMTGVRSAEFDRLNGIDDSTVEQAQKWVAKAARGEGKLDAEQWRQIITVANEMARVSQVSLGKIKEQRSPELVQAGVNPESVFSQLGNWEPFNFEKQGWETPASMTQHKLVENDKKRRQENNQTAMNALKELTPEQINKLVAQKREKMKSQVASSKGGSDVQKQTAK